MTTDKAIAHAIRAVLDPVVAALAEEIRGLKQLVEASKRASDLPMALSYERAARELDVSVSTLKRMLAKGKIVNCDVGDGKGIPRSEILRIAEGRRLGAVRPKARLPRVHPPRLSTEREKIRAALREARRSEAESFQRPP